MKIWFVSNEAGEMMEKTIKTSQNKNITESNRIVIVHIKILMVRLVKVLIDIIWKLPTCFVHSLLPPVEYFSQKNFHADYTRSKRVVESCESRTCLKIFHLRSISRGACYHRQMCHIQTVEKILKSAEIS